METPVAIGIPILLMLAMLALFGVTWLFHHHHWRPFAGVFLFVIGLGFFWMLARSEPLKEIRDAPRTATTRTGAGRYGEAASPTPRVAAKPVLTPEQPLPTPAAAESSIPDPQPQTPQPRPDWVDRTPHFETHGDGFREYVITAASGRYLTPAECERAIITAVNEIVVQYVADYVPEESSQETPLDAEYIRGQLVKDWYWEPVDASVGPMNQLHARLVFDRHVRDELESRAREALVATRLKYTAGGTALALLLLGGVYSFLNRGATKTRATA